MKRREEISLKSALGLIAIILIMLLIQAPAHGVMNCTDDNDCDGITDTQETTTIIPQCNLGSGQMTQILCDYQTKDLFVMLLPCGDPKNIVCQTGATKLPDDPLSALSFDANRDLHVIVHRINPAQTFNNSDRNVTDAQEAVRIFENIDTSGSALGYTPTGGTPNNASDSQVLTQEIIGWVESKCLCGPTSDCTTCIDPTTNTKGEANVIAKYIKHTIAHEVGHQMTLRATCNPDIQCHYPTPTSANTTPTHLDYAVYWTQSRSKGITTTKFYIGSQYYTGTNYTPNDRDGLHLR